MPGPIPPFSVAKADQSAANTGKTWQSLAGLETRQPMDIPNLHFVELRGKYSIADLFCLLSIFHRALVIRINLQVGRHDQSERRRHTFVLTLAIIAARPSLLAFINR